MNAIGVEPRGCLAMQGAEACLVFGQQLLAQLRGEQRVVAEPHMPFVNRADKQSLLLEPRQHAL